VTRGQRRTELGSFVISASFPCDRGSRRVPARFANHPMHPPLPNPQSSIPNLQSNPPPSTTAESWGKNLCSADRDMPWPGSYSDKSSFVVYISYTGSP